MINTMLHSTQDGRIACFSLENQRTINSNILNFGHDSGALQTLSRPAGDKEGSTAGNIHEQSFTGIDSTVVFIVLTLPYKRAPGTEYYYDTVLSWCRIESWAHDNDIF